MSIESARPQPEPAKKPVHSPGPKAAAAQPKAPAKPSATSKPIASVSPQSAAASKGIASPVSLAEAGEDRTDGSPHHWGTFAAATLTSMLVHLIALVAMGLYVLPVVKPQAVQPLVAAVEQKPDEQIETEVLKVEEQIEPEFTSTDVSTAATTLSVESVVSDLRPQEMINTQVELSEIGIKVMPSQDLTIRLGGGNLTGTLVGSRSEAGKKAAVASRGGSDASEAAVAAALRWLAEHQMPDGGWTFDLTKCPTCQGKCRHSGERVNSRNAATALALLPFLGAGQTHKVGKYQKTVLGGLIYLTTPGPAGNRQLRVGPNGADFTPDGGNFYTQGLCAMALSEAYAMSNDPNLIGPAQAALNYVMYAQDPVGGGWRYAPRQPGDTSVVGWNLMALKSGHMGHLAIGPQVVPATMRFLDSVQVQGGAKYGYDRPGYGASTTAVGLLLRMYMGWDREKEPLQQGVEFLAKTGPSPNNTYFNYYATQVLHQYEGELWDQWNLTMREQLVSTQAKTGHEAGSWYVYGPHNDSGGRLYVTSLHALTLEVYYRHLPLYRAKKDDDF